MTPTPLSACKAAYRYADAADRRLVGGPNAAGHTTYYPDGRVRIWDGTWGPGDRHETVLPSAARTVAFEARWAEEVRRWADEDAARVEACGYVSRVRVH